MQYAYLFANLLALIPWLILFLIRKDTRKEMIWSGIIVGILALISEQIWYTKDWWNPLTLTGTTVGVEDFMGGFASGGMAAVLYKEVFKKDEYKSDIPLNTKHLLIATIILGLILADSLFRFFGMFSYYANLIGFSLMAIVGLTARPDLITESLVGGFLLTVVAMPVYWITSYIFPFWIQTTWQINHISNIYFLGIPYEDLVWWFVAGANIAIAYDIYNRYRIRKLPSS